ncbi:polysaccharide deacetylase family protein [Streptomyces griseorubiginosus]|uniref:polysaccharide deacetylase family protein n=1 Tax=Streptomyces griseorubiginosus TaxID=67304 RepID=UPI003664D243
MRPRALVAVGLAAALLTGCAQSVDPIERLGRKAAQRVGSYGPPGADGRPYRHWGLTAPLPAPPRRPARPLPVDPGGPLPVVKRVPTTDKVVFLTYDDGAERDPRFVDLVRELRLPVSVFLTDSVVGPGYGHFARLQSVGASIQNHTLDHPALRGLPYAGQRAEICGQQEKLHARFGIRPRLFRPPYGTYDTTTRHAATDCGLSALVLWSVSVQGHGSEHPLRPGDIVAVASGEEQGPSLTQRTTTVLREIERRGLTVGRLEDYL